MRISRKEANEIVRRQKVQVCQNLYHTLIVEIPESMDDIISALSKIEKKHLKVRNNG